MTPRLDYHQAAPDAVSRCWNCRHTPTGAGSLARHA